MAGPTGATGPTGPTGPTGASGQPHSVSVTLQASAWNSNAQTVSVTGVLADETAQLVTPVPALASQSAYYEAGVLCTGQAAGQLVFECSTVPSADLTVYVVIQSLA